MGVLCLTSQDHDFFYIIDIMRSDSGSTLAMIRRMSYAAPRFATLDALRLQVWTAQPDGTLDFANAFVTSYFRVTRERVLEHG